MTQETINLIIFQFFLFLITRMQHVYIHFIFFLSRIELPVSEFMVLRNSHPIIIIFLNSGRCNSITRQNRPQPLLFHRKEKVVMVTTLPSLAAPEVVMWRTSMPATGWRQSYYKHRESPWLQDSWGQLGVHLGPPGPRWTPCWPHEPCYLGHHGRSCETKFTRVSLYSRNHER